MKGHDADNFQLRGRSQIALTRLWPLETTYPKYIDIGEWIPFSEIRKISPFLLLWEGQKMLRNLHFTFDWHNIGQK